MKLEKAKEIENKINDYVRQFVIPINELCGKEKKLKAEVNVKWKRTIEKGPFPIGSDLKTPRLFAQKELKKFYAIACALELAIMLFALWICVACVTTVFSKSDNIFSFMIPIALGVIAVVLRKGFVDGGLWEFLEYKEKINKDQKQEDLLNKFLEFDTIVSDCMVLEAENERKIKEIAAEIIELNANDRFADDYRANFIYACVNKNLGVGMPELFFDILRRPNIESFDQAMNAYEEAIREEKREEEKMKKLAELITGVPQKEKIYIDDEKMMMLEMEEQAELEEIIAEEENQ